MRVTERMGAVAALQLAGVCGVEGGASTSLPGGGELVVFRDIAAMVMPAEYVEPEPTDDTMAAYHEMVDAVFARRAVLPAPPGVVFRNRDTLLRWLELHYVTLSDGLSFVDGRVSARVHLVLRGGFTANEETPQLPALASGIFLVLRQHAAAVVSLRPTNGIPRQSMAYLLEKDRWDMFAALVKEEAARHAMLSIHLTGPWPPHDFVRMQFGA